MGKFPCHCGNVISDSTYPCESVGTLRWQDEFELCDRESTDKVAEFLTAIKNGNRDEWIANYFLPLYPSDIEDHKVISDIYTKEFNERGHEVYRCPNGERIYVQTEFYSDDWTCYEKRRQ
jgi:hypothetical protein